MFVNAWASEDDLFAFSAGEIKQLKVSLSPSSGTPFRFDLTKFEIRKTEHGPIVMPRQTKTEWARG